MPMDHVVVRYHEVALKKTNRTEFVARLTDNMLRALEGTGVVRNHRAPGRIILHLPDPMLWPEVRDRLSRVFGVANFLLCQRAEGTIEEIFERIARDAARRAFASFAVRTKRCDKSFPIPSPEVSARVGATVQRLTASPVDLRQPAMEIHVEILPREILYSFEKVSGPGGLPIDSSGTVLTLLSGGIDSIVAAHRMLARGCRVELVHFHAFPHQTRASLEKALELARLLEAWQPHTRLHAVPIGDAQKRIVAFAPRRARVVLYRRTMLRIAERLAAASGATALVTGDSLGQVASQTLPNLIAIGDACAIPVLRPLIAMDKEEIIFYARRIGSYEISVQPEEDCCQLWVPKHPATRMSIGAARAAEEPLDLDGLVRDAVAATETFQPGAGPTALNPVPLEPD